MATKKKGIPKKGSLMERFGAPGIIKKTASALGAGGTSLTSSMFYTPELTPESWLLPKSRQEVLKWGIFLRSRDFASHKSIGEMQIGDEVFTESGKTRKIINKVESNYSGKAVRITPHKVSIYPLEFSYGHPIPAIHCPIYDRGFSQFRKQIIRDYKNGKDLISHSRIIPTEYLKKGDYLLIPRYSKIKSLPNIFGPNFEWSEDVFEVLGWYVAEGFADNQKLGLQLGEDEKEICEWILQIFLEKFKVEAGKIRLNGRHPRVEIRDDVCGIFLKEFGHGAQNRKIPEWILDAEPKYVAAFLRGWMKGDKTVKLDNPKKLRANVSTVSQELAEWGFLLFTKLGCLPSFSRRALDPEKITFSDGKHPKTIALYVYSLGIFGEDVKKVFPTAEFDSSGTFTKHLSDSKYLYVPIEKIEHFDYDGPSYDILTEDQTYAVPIVSYACSTHGKIVENFGHKEIKDLDIGQKVLTIFGDQRPIVDKISRPYKGLINTITPKDFSPTILTELDAVYGIKVKRPGWNKEDSEKFIHSLQDKSIRPFDKLSWITASILEPGDLLAVPKFREVRESEIDLSKYIIQKLSNWERYEVKKDSIIVSQKDEKYSIPRFIRINSEMARFIGRYFSSGLTDASISLYGKINEKDLKWIKDLGIPESRISSDKNRTKIHSILLANFLKAEFGEGNRHDKKIPDFLIYADNQAVAAFIDVLFEKRRGRKLNKLTTTKEFGYKLFFLGTKCNRLLTVKNTSLSGYVHVKEVPIVLSDEGFFFIPVEENCSQSFKGDLHHITVDSGTIAIPFIVHNCRIFFNLEPYIQSILCFHSRYPFSKFKLTSESQEVTDFFEAMIDTDKWSLLDFILRQSLTYQLYGEAVNFGNWNEKEKKWDRFILLEPEIVEVHQDIYDDEPRFELIPTEELRKIVNSPNPENISRKEKFPEIVIEAIKSGKNIPLDPKAVSILARTTSPGAIRGTPICQCLFKILIFQDYIRLAQMRIAERHQLPFELWTVGNLEHNILPTDDDLEKVRNMINDAIQNPPFVLVYPPILNYQALGVKDRLLNIYEDLGYVENQILVGLGVNKNLILGEGPSFSNVKTMALHRLVMEYQAQRDLVERWIYNKMFRRVSLENKFFSFKGDKKKLIIPKIEWEKSLDIENQENERKSYVDLHKSGYISTKTLFSRFPNIDFDSEQKHLEAEIGTIYDKKDKRLPEKFEAKPKSEEPLSPPVPPMVPPGGVLETPLPPTPPPVAPPT